MGFKDRGQFGGFRLGYEGFRGLKVHQNAPLLANAAGSLHNLSSWDYYQVPAWCRM